MDNLSGVTSVTLTILFDDIDSLTVDATQFGYENLTTERDVTVVTLDAERDAARHEHGARAGE